MKRVVRRITTAGYKNIAKPVLFANHPDKVHEGMIRMAKGVQRVPLVKDVMKVWAYRNDKYLAQEILGIKFRNPVGLAAGLDKNADTVGVMQAVGFGWMTAGSVTAVPCEGNPKPWFHRLKQSRSLVVNVGLANRGADMVARHIRKYSSKLFRNFPLNISTAKTNSKEVVSDAEGVKDYCTSLSIMNNEPNVAMLEINISCPNTYGGEPFTTPERLDMLLSETDKLKLKKPVFIKMPISLEWLEFKSLLEVIVKHNIQGVSIGNLQKDRSKAKLKDELSDDIKGNLSGEPCRHISTELVSKTYKLYGKKLVIVGIGGVFSAEDAYDKIKAGASLVAMVTGVIFEGPQVVGEINQGLVALLKKDGYANLAEAVGKDVL